MSNILNFIKNNYVDYEIEFFKSNDDIIFVVYHKEVY